MDFAAPAQDWHPDAVAAALWPQSRCTASTTTNAATLGPESGRLQIFAGIVALTVLVFSWRRGSAGRDLEDRRAADDDNSDGDSSDDNNSSSGEDSTSTEDSNWYPEASRVLDRHTALSPLHKRRNRIYDAPPLPRTRNPRAPIGYGSRDGLRTRRGLAYTQAQHPLFGSIQYAVPRPRDPVAVSAAAVSAAPLPAPVASCPDDVRPEPRERERERERERDQFSASPLNLSDDDDEVSTILAAAQMQIMRSSNRLSCPSTSEGSVDDQEPASSKQLTPRHQEGPSQLPGRDGGRLFLDVRFEAPKTLRQPVCTSPGVVARLGLILPQGRELARRGTLEAAPQFSAVAPRAGHTAPMLRFPSPSEFSSASSPVSGRTSACASSTWDFLSEAGTASSSSPGQDPSGAAHNRRSSDGEIYSENDERLGDGDARANDDDDDDISVSLTECSNSSSSSSSSTGSE